MITAGSPAQWAINSQTNVRVLRRSRRPEYVFLFLNAYTGYCFPTVLKVLIDKSFKEMGLKYISDLLEEYKPGLVFRLDCITALSVFCLLCIEEMLETPKLL